MCLNYIAICKSCGPNEFVKRNQERPETVKNTYCCISGAYLLRTFPCRLLEELNATPFSLE